MRAVVRNAIKQGWQCVRNGGGHLTLISPSGARMTIGSTPGAGRSYENALARMKALGYRPGKQKRRRRP